MTTPEQRDEELDPRLEQALRARLREVDDLVPPPAPDFAARAVAAARETAPAPEDVPERLAPVVPLHRRGWAKALVGVAATLVLGTGVVTGLQHLGGGGGSSAASGSAASGEEQPGVASPASIPQGASTTGRTSVDADAGGGAVTLSATRATGPAGTPLPEAVARLQQRLLTPPYDATRATVALRGTTVVVLLPATVGGRASVDPALTALVDGALPAGTPVEYRAG